jgi:type II secretory pathway component GspD/PulD (secretin)
MPRLLFAALALGLVAVGRAQNPPAAPPAAKLRAALAETADVVFEDKSLVEVAEYFKNKLKAEVRYDPAVLAGLGIDPAAIQYTVKLRGGKVRDGLKAALAPANLSYAVVGGSIYVGPEEHVIHQQMRQRVSVDGEATTLSAVLKALADETGANVVVDPRVEAKAQQAAVKLKLDDVPLETAVRLVVEVAGFATVRMNNVLFVTTEERADRLRPVADPPTPAAVPVPAAGVLPAEVPPRPPVGR